MSDQEVNTQGPSQQRKQLRAQIQALKKTVTKGDKKQKKLVAEQINALEAQISQLTLLKQDKEQIPEVNLEPQQQEEKKPSRQQLRKQKKLAEMEKIRQEALDEPDADLAAIEREQIEARLSERGLSIVKIQADGNCLFNALCDQLTHVQYKVQLSQQDLRDRAVEFMMEHRENFAPFATDENGDPVYDFDLYCNDMRGTQWGGQLEIQALSQQLQVQIQVYRADGHVLKVGEQFDCILKVSYHEHEYGLGSHYNSLI